MTKSALLTIGKQYARLHEMEARVRDLRNKFRDRSLKGRPFWQSATIGATGIIMTVSLAEYLEQAPEAKPELCQYDSLQTGKKMAYMRYPATAIGEIRKGYWFWIEASTEAVPVADLPKLVEDEARAAYEKGLTSPSAGVRQEAA